jgi:hypothetical protein
MPNANTAAAIIARIGRLAMACADGTEQPQCGVCRPQAPTKERPRPDAQSAAGSADKGNFNMHRACKFRPTAVHELAR